VATAAVTGVATAAVTGVATAAVTGVATAAGPAEVVSCIADGVGRHRLRVALLSL
jgi:hypothetical protein